MTDAGHDHLMKVFWGALDLDDEARVSYLDRACDGDAEFRAEVESMLEYDAADSDIFAATGSGVGLVGKVLGADDEEPAVPERIGQYRPVRVLGQGGMGIVYEAEQEAPRRTVALKMIRPGVMSRQHLRRFRLEAELLGRLHHPGIAQIFEAGTIDTGDGGQPFFAMELIHGTSITSFSLEKGLGTRARLELFIQVCDAVQHAHQKGIVHRDLKPDNVLVDERGQTRILDFGVARATDADIQVTTIQTDPGALIGTVPYMSPEQVTGRCEDVDTRSDVYALGVMLFELLTERLPHDLRGRSIVEAARIIRDDDPTRLGSVATEFRGDLDAIVGKALEKEPARRYQTAAEIAVDIRHFLASEPIMARPPTTAYQLRRFARRHRAIVIGAAVAFVALTIGLVAAILFAVEAQGKAAEAQWATYRSEIANAAEAVGRGEFRKVQDALAVAPAHLHGWEREHLRARVSVHRVQQTAPDGLVWSAAHWPPGRGPLTLASGDGIVRVINGFDGQSVREFEATGALTYPVMSADGSRVAAFEETTNTVHVWDLDDSGHWAIHSESPPASLDRTGARVACITRHHKEATVIEVETGVVQSIHHMIGSGNITLSHDGSRIAMVGKAELRVEQVGAGGPVRRASVRGVEPSIAWSNDDQFLVLTLFVRRGVRVYRADTLELVMETPVLDRRPRRTAFSPDDRTLAIGDAIGVSFWDLETNSLLASIPVPAGGIGGIWLAFEPNGSRLISVQQNALTIVDVAAPAVTTVSDSTYLYLVAFSPDGSLLATGGLSGAVHLWDVLDGRRVGSLLTGETFIGQLWFSEDGASVYTASRSVSFDDVVEIWSITEAAQQRVFLHNNQRWREYLRPGAHAVTGVGGVGWQISTSGAHLVFGRGHKPETVVFRLPANELITTIPVYATAVSISPDDRLVATANNSTAVVQLWDALSAEPRQTLRAASGEIIHGIVFSPDGTRVVGAGSSGAIHFWDTATGDLVCSFKEHDDYVHGVIFSDDGTRLASASGDGTAKLFDTVLRAERERERLEMRARREAMRPTVAQWRADGVEEAEVAARLDADASLTSADRRVLFAGWTSG